MEEYVEYISRSPEDTARISAEIATQLRAGDIILYEGDMGAGKTTFTKGLAAALGITDPVTSPTFALVNEYTCRCSTSICTVSTATTTSTL